ncbi:MAG TPA: hypothetical protein VGH04_14895, partial [Gemmatimonadaceae bacterium]
WHLTTHQGRRTFAHFAALRDRSVELRIEAASPGTGRGVLRLVLVDARMSSVKWIGEVTSDSAPAFGPSITASIASKLSAIIAP